MKKAASTAIAVRQHSVKEQQAVINKMAPALRKVYVKIRDERVDMQTTSLHYYRGLGEHIHAVTDDINKYGAGAIKQLSVALDLAADVLYKASAFATLYDESEFAQLLELRTSTDDGLMWSHVVQLLPVSDHKQRAKLQELAARNNWTCNELRDAVTELMGSQGQQRRTRAPGKVVQPKTPMQGMRNFCVGANEYVQRGKQLWFEFFETAASLPPDSVDAEMLSQADRVVTQATEVVETAKRELVDATKLRDRYHKIVDARKTAKAKKGQEEPEEDSDEDE